MHITPASTYQRPAQAKANAQSARRREAVVHSVQVKGNKKKYLINNKRETFKT
jgi:hypothetical protein